MLLTEFGFRSASASQELGFSSSIYSNDLNIRMANSDWGQSIFDWLGVMHSTTLICEGPRSESVDAWHFWFSRFHSTNAELCNANNIQKTQFLL